MRISEPPCASTSGRSPASCSSRTGSTSIPSSAPCRRPRSKGRSSSIFFKGRKGGKARPSRALMPPGTLYVVATPLGNLGDLSTRGAEVLRTVPVVAAEDTRRTRGLLSHLGASPSLLSFHAHSDDQRLDSLLETLRSGRDVALVSDAGTPTVSDPGADLVGLARAAGIPVV